MTSKNIKTEKSNRDSEGNRLVRKEEVKKYSCLKCGTPFDAYPPDDHHTFASRDPNQYKDNIKVTYICKECKNENVIYWCYIPLYTT